MSTTPETSSDASRATEEPGTYRAWYAEFDAARECEGKLEELATIREWYGHFDAGKWDREFESDVVAGRLDWLADEARKDLREGRCIDR
jgi:hypothetical protein